MAYGKNYDGTLMSWVSFVLDQRKHPWHVSIKTGLARTTVVTDDELCNFFFGHVFKNERKLWRENEGERTRTASSIEFC